MNALITPHGMSSESYIPSAPLKLVIRLLLTIALVWLLSTFLDQYFYLDGGLSAYIIIASLLTLMNVLVRPVLHVIALPFKLFATIIAWIIVNGGFLWITLQITERMDPNIVILHIEGGIAGWLLIGFIVGIANWLFKEVLK